MHKVTVKNANLLLALALAGVCWLNVPWLEEAVAGPGVHAQDTHTNPVEGDWLAEEAWGDDNADPRGRYASVDAAKHVLDLNSRIPCEYAGSVSPTSALQTPLFPLCEFLHSYLI